MTTRNTPTYVEDPGELSLKVDGFNINLSVLGSDSIIKFPPHMARWLAKELQMHAAEVDRKAARAVCDKAAEVMKR